MSRGELAGERMEVALNTQDQEDEHSCFSDNTHRDIVANALGSGLLASGALMGFLPAICRKLLGEELAMPSVGTWWCGEKPALDYVRERHAFGKPLVEHEGVGFQLADNDMDLMTARLHILHTAWLLDKGERGAFDLLVLRYQHKVVKLVTRYLRDPADAVDLGQRGGAGQ